jgi:HSP20 family protein
MNITPYRKTNVDSPWMNLLDFDREFDELIRRPFRDSLAGGDWNPAIDVFDSKDEILVKADLPGLKKEEIEVSIHDGALFIRGEKKEEKDRKEKGRLRNERFYGRFERIVTLPIAVDDSRAKATYKNGVLELTLPKREEAKPKEIKLDIQ